MNIKSGLGAMCTSILKSTIYSAFLYLILLTIASLLLWLTPLPEGASLFLGMGSLCVASLLAGMFGGYHFKKRGFFYGLIYAIILLGILFLIYSIFFHTMAFSLGGSLKYLLCLACGSIGGMIAVNR